MRISWVCSAARQTREEVRREVVRREVPSGARERSEGGADTGGSSRPAVGSSLADEVGEAADGGLR